MELKHLIPFPEKEKPHSGKIRRRTPPAVIAGVSLGMLLAVIGGGTALYQKIAGRRIAALDTSSAAFLGYSGSGTVDPDFRPEDTMLQTLEAEMEETASRGGSTVYQQKLIDSIVCGFDRSTGLSNDDVITYACTIDAGLARQAGYRFSDTQKSYRVQGLPEYEEIDPFRNVTAAWIWQNGQADLSLNVPQEFTDLGISYSWDYSGGSSVTLRADADEETLRAAGIVLTAAETVVETGRKPQAVLSYDSLSEEEKQAIIAQASQLLEEELSQCGHVLQGSGSVTVTGWDDGTLQQTGDGFTVSFTLRTDGRQWSSWFSRYRVSYAGTVWRDSTGSVHFSDTPSHACTVSGFFGQYSMEESHHD